MGHLHTRGSFSRKNWQSLRSSSRNQKRRWWHMQDKEQIITSKGKDQQPLADSDLAFSECCASAGSDRAYSRARALGASSKGPGTGLAADPERQINCGLERKASDSRFRLSGKACDLQTRLS